MGKATELALLKVELDVVSMPPLEAIKDKDEEDVIDEFMSLYRDQDYSPNEISDERQCQQL
jgi:hypothetical protein